MLLQAVQKVFQKPSYMLVALITGVIVFVFTTWLLNIGLLVSVLGSPDIAFSNKLELPINLIGSITTNFTVLAASYTIAIAILFGINIAMVTYFLKHRIKDASQSGFATGFLGAGSGVLGMGCAACGSFLLGTILSFFGASGILALLPLKGEEFGIIGVILLSVSIYLTAKQIQNPAVCKIKINNQQP